MTSLWNRKVKRVSHDHFNKVECPYCGCIIPMTTLEIRDLVYFSGTTMHCLCGRKFTAEMVSVSIKGVK